MGFPILMGFSEILSMYKICQNVKKLNMWVQYAHLKATWPKVCVCTVCPWVIILNNACVCHYFTVLTLSIEKSLLCFPLVQKENIIRFYKLVVFKISTNYILFLFLLGLPTKIISMNREKLLSFGFKNLLAQLRLRL